jgi:hypothetical protein
MIMKKLSVFFLIVLCIALTSAMGYAKDADAGTTPDKNFHYMQSFRNVQPDLGIDIEAARSTAQAGTTWLGSWDFDAGANCVEQGWLHADMRAQPAEFWHVDDFSGLAGGDYGLLYPLEATKSAWCGARPNAASLVVCGYLSLPGYGNNWTQHFCSPCLAVTGDVELNYLVAWDSEPGFDQTTVQYNLCGGSWQNIASAANGGAYDGFSGPIFDTVSLSAASHSGSARFRFQFVSDGGWSDEDGIWNTDGAIILDSLTVRDGSGVLSFENFEGANVGDLGAGDWNSCNDPGYGDFAALYNGVTLLQEDPCATDFDCVWSFFTGSTYTYSCGGFPATIAIPYVNQRGQYIQNHIRSPVLPWTGTGTVAEMAFNVYRDLPLDNLVFYEWRIRSWHNGCPSVWITDWSVWFGPNKDWFPEVWQFGQHVELGATDVQLSVGVRDMCDLWCGIVGSGDCHSHAPLIDSIRIYRVALSGAQWRVNDFDLFQDNFAADGTTTGTVRVDTGNDILPRTSAGILPGDSVVVTVNDPEYGVAGDPYTSFGPAVWGFVRVDPPQAAKSGHALTDDPFRWPVVDSVLSSGGDKWYIVRMDTSFGSPARNQAIPGEFCLDLNDNLLTPGDTLWFFFGAQSDVSGQVLYYFHAEHVNDGIGIGARLTTSDINDAMNNAEEMTCLPAAGLLPGNDILYVDDASGRGTQPYFDTAFQQLGIFEKVDRYDVRGPDSNTGNGLGARVVNVYQQLIPVYKKILWNSTNLNNGLIGDGDAANEKSNDFEALFNFIDQSNRDPGLWISGDYNATEWINLATPSPTALRTVYMNFDVVTRDHKLVGLPVSPFVIGAAGGEFVDVIGPDTLVAFGGCALVNEFDVLQQTGQSVAQAYYEGNTAYPAILSQRSTNATGSTASVMLSGYSYHYTRDDRPASIMDRVIHLKKVLAFLGNATSATGVTSTGYQNSLSQNYPNPFNPTTTIHYTVKRRANVSLRIYNVAGQLIRTLVDEAKTAGEVHTATWDGRNGAGQSVSSGVYFYKLVTGDFVQTKKMVLLK